jgi:hypothetical protein
MRKLACLLATLSLLSLAGVASAKPSGPTPPFPRLPAGFTHAEINIKIHKELHTLILDRGRIARVSFGQLTLLESDGSRQLIPLSPQTIVQPFFLHLTAADLRRAMLVDTMRIDQGAAVRVRILRPIRPPRHLRSTA